MRRRPLPAVRALHLLAHDEAGSGRVGSAGDCDRPATRRHLPPHSPCPAQDAAAVRCGGVQVRSARVANLDRALRVGHGVCLQRDALALLGGEGPAEERDGRRRRRGSGRRGHRHDGERRGARQRRKRPPVQRMRRSRRGRRLGQQPWEGDGQNQNPDHPTDGAERPPSGGPPAKPRDGGALPNRRRSLPPRPGLPLPLVVRSRDRPGQRAPISVEWTQCRPLSRNNAPRPRCTHRAAETSAEVLPPQRTRSPSKHSEQSR